MPSTYTQQVEVTIPGVNKLGIAWKKASSTSGYTYNNLWLFHLIDTTPRLWMWGVPCSKGWCPLLQEVVSLLKDPSPICQSHVSG